jgi:gamma-glutamyl-gamma-aminobutyrate hydrolase PuuD
VRIAATDANGGIAAAECIFGGLILGVNWRPEAIFESDPNAAALFSAIVECARADLPVRVYDYE